MLLAPLAFAPAVAAAWWLTGRPGLPWMAVAIAAVSAAVEAVYFGLLAGAYRRGDLSAVYAVARGTAPLPAIAVGLLLLGERLAPAAVLGVAVLVLGIWLARPPGRAAGTALSLALATGVAIAAYTSLDRLGVRMGPWWLYGWLVFALTGLWLLPWGARPGGEPVPRALLLGGLAMVTYGFVLAALSFAPLALVAPVREVGVVLVAVYGVARLGEREALTRKLFGAGLVVAGAALSVL